MGTILGCWAGSSAVGQTAGSQVAAAYSLYGPQTQLVVARPTGAAQDSAEPSSLPCLLTC